MISANLVCRAKTKTTVSTTTKVTRKPLTTALSTVTQPSPPRLPTAQPLGQTFSSHRSVRQLCQGITSAKTSVAPIPCPSSGIRLGGNCCWLSENVKCEVSTSAIFPTYLSDESFRLPIRGMALVGTSCHRTPYSLSWDHFAYDFTRVQLVLFPPHCRNEVSSFLTSTVCFSLLVFCMFQTLRLPRKKVDQYAEKIEFLNIEGE